jgi:effector-binding domain-containing protein
MHVKTFAPVTVLYSTHCTSFEQLHEFGPVVAELYAEAGRRNVINGPLHWIYYDMDEQPGGLFTLDIAIPIRKPFASKRFDVKKLDLFRALTFPHEGLWEHLPGSRQQIMKRLEENNIPVSHECRELFLNIDLEHPENNITEIQIGLEAIIPQTTEHEKKRLLPVHI